MEMSGIEEYCRVGYIGVFIFNVALNVALKYSYTQKNWNSVKQYEQVLNTYLQDIPLN